MTRIITILILLCHFSTFGNDFLMVRKVTHSEGLSENTIIDIAQDSTGYIWIGTREGLNRYDGYSSKRFFADTKHHKGLRSSSILQIFIDGHSNIWIQHSAGLDVYDPVDESFRPLELSIDNKPINFISDAIDQSGVKWLSTSRYGLVGVNPHNNEVVFQSTEIQSPQTFCRKNDTIIYITHNNRIKAFNTLTRTYIDSSVPQLQGGIGSAHYYAGLLWIRTTNGVYVFDEKTNKTESIESFFLDKNNRAFIDFNKTYTTDIVELEGKLWLSTDGLGIYIIDAFNDFSVDNITMFSSKHSISTDAIRCLLPDKDHNMWIGTVHNGINLITKQQKKFANLQYINDQTNLPVGNYSTFQEDKQNNLWVATFDGLGLIDQETMKIKRFVARDNVIISMTIDWDGDIYLGTYKNGLLKYSPYSNKLVPFKVGRTGFEGQTISALTTDHLGNIWIGTSSRMYKYNRKANKVEFIDHRKLSRITTLIEDRDKNIWVGTLNGLHLIPNGTDTNHRHFHQDKTLQTLSKHHINSLSEDKQGNIWVGTNGFGIFQVTTKTHEILPFEKDDKLFSNIIHSIEEDNQQNIWFTTNSGLVRLNPKSGKMEVFDYADGLSNNQFIDEALYLTYSGKMLCGGEKGIDYFYPDRIKTNPHPPKVVVNGIFFESKTGEATDSFHRKLNANDTITFNYNQSYFGFEFTGLEYANPQKIKYAYQLEGFNHSWINGNESRTVTYGYVPPGNYTFKVKAANSDGVWSEPATIKVIVEPPFSKTPLAYALYLITLALIFYAIYRYLLERKLLRNKLEYESKERKRIEELNQLKLRVFTHISHEFKTPLSLIIAPAQELIKRLKGSEKNTKDLEIIQNNAQKLQVLVNEILEVRKIESGAFQMAKANIDVVTFIKNSCDSFYHWANQKNIEFTFESDTEELVLNIDQGLMEKVLYNLISNALKFTQKGSVNVSLNTFNDHCLITVKDSGIGISKDDQEKLFNMFFRAEQQDGEIEGTGIGLALSKELVELHEGTLTVESEQHVGSSFIVRLPVPLEKLQKDTTVILEDQTTATAELANEASVLLVDDNHELRKFLAEKLSHYFKVDEATNGVEALEIARKNQPQIILSDVMMPEMDGWGLCKAVKTDIKISHIPVVLLTALNGDENTIKGLELGADAYLTKPFNLDHVVSLLNSLLKNRDHMRQAFSKGQLEKIKSEELTKLDQDFLKNARAYIQANLSNPDFSVQTLSDHLAMSRVNLHHKMKALCNISPSDLIMQIRLMEAVTLLKEKRYQISEIADITGFSSASHFSRSFKKHYGGTPRDFLNGKISIEILHV
ncbi:hybrid sensor histidine kinase/response regulator [Puteibacter caeruleilacunae]|nr:hybrid sensor histidine kinase/response regulator [Puteibacter caeruleilacunae]